MRTFSALAGAAALGGALALAAPTAHAAPAAPAHSAPRGADDECARAVAAADAAEAEYETALRDHKRLTGEGGHPDRSQEAQLRETRSAADAAASQAARYCPDAELPSGRVGTGTGSTGRPLELDGTTVGAAGAACLLVAGAGGAWLARSRQRDDRDQRA
ncbi:hypothetical protein [Streptomyces sp. HNM0574]|uniref:hypothetical protein n=1 Tax=Streptomyces sp. HNM0574 TaxID=2714954 RepID=UPI00146C127E|nr:hypothetical protein [Streptomyces sp. HNM0574]NLU70176.1 hypothetical protein [Streptomyces sp. HNM0574]